MKREDLQALSLEKDVIDKIMTLNQTDEEAHKKALKSQRTEIATLNGKITELTTKVQSYDGVDVKALQTSVKDWETKYQTDIQAEKKNSAVKLAIAKCGAKSEKALSGFLDLEKVKLTDKGELEGFNEQIEAIKKENAYLFSDEPAKPKDVILGGEHGGGAPEVLSLEQAIGAHYQN